MKNRLALVVLMSITFLGYSQTNPSDSIIDGSFIIAASCEMDTSVTFHFDSAINWLDSTGFSKSNYTFTAGNENYCELIVATKSCRCSDCSFTKIIIVRLDPLDTSDLIHLSPTNTTWLVRNVWLFDPFEYNFVGTLDFGKHELRINPTFKERPDLLGSGTTIRTSLLAKPLRD